MLEEPLVWMNGTTPHGAKRLGRMTQRVLPETLLLATLCLADMAWTITAIHMGIARESNPLMAYIFGKGDVLFALVKIGSFMVPLAIMELLRRLRPFFIPVALRCALVAYVALYVIG